MTDEIRTKYVTLGNGQLVLLLVCGISTATFSCYINGLEFQSGIRFGCQEVGKTTRTVVWCPYTRSVR